VLLFPFPLSFLRSFDCETLQPLPPTFWDRFKSFLFFRLRFSTFLLQTITVNSATTPPVCFSGSVVMDALGAKSLKPFFRCFTGFFRFCFHRIQFFVGMCDQELFFFLSNSVVSPVPIPPQPGWSSGHFFLVDCTVKVLSILSAPKVAQAHMRIHLFFLFSACRKGDRLEPWAGLLRFSIFICSRDPRLPPFRIV